MKNNLKKVTASIMAVASLTLSVFGMNANAVVDTVDTDANGYVRTASGTIIGTCSLSLTSTSVWVQTKSNIGVVDEITAEITEHSGDIGQNSLTRYNADEVSFSTYADGVDYIASHHEIKEGNISGEGNLVADR